MQDDPICPTTPQGSLEETSPLPRPSLHRLPTAPQENGVAATSTQATGAPHSTHSGITDGSCQPAPREDSTGPGAVPVLPTNRTLGHGAAQNTPHAGPRGESAVCTPGVTCSLGDGLGEPGAGGKGRHGGSGLGQMLVKLVQWNQALGSAHGFQNQARVRAGAPSRPPVGKGPLQVW